MKHVETGSLSGVPIELKDADPSDIVTKAINGLQATVEDRLAKLETKSAERMDKLEAKLNRPAAIETETKGDAALERKAIAAFARGDETEIKGMTVGSDPDGGYVVLPTIEAAIRTITRDQSPVRALASAVTIGSDSYELIIDSDDIDSGWVAETSARPKTASPEFKKASIPVHELYAAPPITQKLLDDASADLGAYLEGKIANRFARIEGSAFTVGDGVGKPRGFLTYDTAAVKDFTRDWGKIQHVPTGATNPTDQQLADSLIALSMTLRTPYRGNATWTMSLASALRIRQIKDGSGRYIWQEGLLDGHPDRLLGFPVSYSEDMPGIASGELPIALADWSAGYQIVDRHGLRVIRDNLTEKPLTIFYAYKRVGGAVADFNALKLLKIAAT